MRRGVARQVPEHHAAKPLRLRPRRLGADALGVVVGDERLGGCVPQVRRLRRVVPVARPARGTHVVGRQVAVVEHARVPRPLRGATGGLEQAVVRGAHAGPAVAEERHAQRHLGGRRTGVLECLHRVDHVVARIARGTCRLLERCVEPGGAIPRAVEVVRHEVDEVERLHEALHLEVGDLLHARRRGDAQLVVAVLAIRLLKCVQLAPELLHQQRVVGLVLGAVHHSGVAAGHGVLPVDVDAVEHVAVRLQVQVNAGAHEGLTRCGGECRVGELLRPRPATHADHGAKARVGRLEFAQLVERPAKRAGVPGVTRVELVDVGVRVAEHALAPLHIRERVVDVRHALGGYVAHVVAALVHAPRREVRHHTLTRGGRRGSGCRRGRRGRGGGWGGCGAGCWRGCWSRRGRRRRRGARRHLAHVVAGVERLRRIAALPHGVDDLVPGAGRQRHLEGVARGRRQRARVVHLLQVTPCERT